MITIPERWQAEADVLRGIVLACGLTEAQKWGKPCFTLDGKNIVLIQGFKEHCDLLFFQGALLKDVKKLLVRMGENTQAARQMRFTSVKEIAGLAPTIKAYVREAIANEKAGLKVKLKTPAELVLPEELKKAFAKSAAFKTAFKAMTPGCQREYVFYFSGAKQAATREARIEKYRQQILSGKRMRG